MAKMPSFRAKKLSKPSVKKPRSAGNVPGKKFEARVQLLEQEIKFAQALAGHEPRIQAKVLKNLKKWLVLRSKSSYRKFWMRFHGKIRRFNVLLVGFLQLLPRRTF